MRVVCGGGVGVDVLGASSAESRDRCASPFRHARTKTSRVQLLRALSRSWKYENRKEKKKIFKKEEENEGEEEKKG